MASRASLHAGWQSSWKRHRRPCHVVVSFTADGGAVRGLQRHLPATAARNRVGDSFSGWSLVLWRPVGYTGHQSRGAAMGGASLVSLINGWRTQTSGSPTLKAVSTGRSCRLRGGDGPQRSPPLSNQLLNWIQRRINQFEWHPAKTHRCSNEPLGVRTPIEANYQNEITAVLIRIMSHNHQLQLK